MLRSAWRLSWVSCAGLMLHAQQDKPPADPEPHFFRYQRAVHLTSSPMSLACAILDEDVLQHATATLDDLRLYRGLLEQLDRLDTGSAAPLAAARADVGALVPFAITQSGVFDADTAQVQALNVAVHRNASGSMLSFDLAMPPRPYANVALELKAHDFVGTVAVWGGAALGARTTPLDTAGTLFDLTSLGLARNTTFALAETSYPFLHVELTLRSLAHPAQSFGAAILSGAAVPPSREAQTEYVVAESAAPVRSSDETVAHFIVPAHVPVERLAFRLAGGPQHADFLRHVHVTARSTDASGAPIQESFSGGIFAVRRTVDGVPLDLQQLTIPMELGANLQRQATVDITVENSEAGTVPITAVELQMRQRRICFEMPPPHQELSLFYGDAALGLTQFAATDGLRQALHSGVMSPANTLLRTKSSMQEGSARLGPEQVNPVYRPRGETRTYRDRHPDLWWIVLLAAVAVAGLVGLRATRYRTR
jgi:hypothetical protein